MVQFNHNIIHLSNLWNNKLVFLPKNKNNIIEDLDIVKMWIFTKVEKEKYKLKLKISAL
jgi:hypothetical protein